MSPFWKKCWINTTCVSQRLVSKCWLGCLSNFLLCMRCVCVCALVAPLTRRVLLVLLQHPQSVVLSVVGHRGPVVPARAVVVYDPPPLPQQRGLAGRRSVVWRLNLQMSELHRALQQQQQKQRNGYQLVHGGVPSRRGQFCYWKTPSADHKEIRAIRATRLPVEVSV